MLDLQPDQQKVDPAYNHILEVIFTLRIFKLDMQTILNTHIHLNTAVDLRWNTVAVNPNVLFANDVLDAPGDGGADEIAQFHVDAVVGFVLFFDRFEVEGEGLRVLEFAWSGEFLDEREEFVVVAAVEEHFLVRNELVNVVGGGEKYFKAAVLLVVERLRKHIRGTILLPRHALH